MLIICFADNQKGRREREKKKQGKIIKSPRKYFAQP